MALTVTSLIAITPVAQLGPVTRTPMSPPKIDGSALVNLRWPSQVSCFKTGKGSILWGDFLVGWHQHGGGPMNASPHPLQCRHRIAEKDLVWKSYTMQRPCLSAATRRLGLLIEKKYTAATLFEDTCLSPVDHQVFTPQFPAAAADQLYELASGRAGANAEPPHLSHKLRCFWYWWKRLLLLIITTLYQHADFAYASAPIVPTELFKRISIPQ